MITNFLFLNRYLSEYTWLLQQCPLISNLYRFIYFSFEHYYNKGRFYAVPSGRSKSEETSRKISKFSDGAGIRIECGSIAFPLSYPASWLFQRFFLTVCADRISPKLSLTLRKKSINYPSGRVAQWKSVQPALEKSRLLCNFFRFVSTFPLSITITVIIVFLKTMNVLNIQCISTQCHRLDFKIGTEIPVRSHAEAKIFSKQVFRFRIWFCLHFKVIRYQTRFIPIRFRLLAVTALGATSEGLGGSAS